MSQRKSAFTLLEVLVVIAIIGLVVAIALPVLAMGRASARNAVCVSNERQIGIASQAYFADHKYFMPWMTRQAGAYDSDILVCPAHGQPNTLPPEVTGSSADILISYGFNPEYDIARKRYQQLQSPSQLILAYEGNGQLDAASVSVTTAGSGSSGSSSTPGGYAISGNQVTITHFPPGSRRDAMVMTVGLAALQAHLNHGGADQDVGVVSPGVVGHPGHVVIVVGEVGDALVKHLPEVGFAGGGVCQSPGHGQGRQ